MSGEPDRFDVVVVGAGPAGALAARGAALRGRSVLLVERQRFPREKVCGCCVNAAALATLSGVGLDGLCDDLGARPTRRLTVWHGGRSAAIGLPGGVSVSRGALDAALVREAQEAGVGFLDGVSAKVTAMGHDAEQGHTVRLGNGRSVRARVVVAADGLAGTSLSGVKGFEAVVQPDARMGMGTVTGSASAADRGVEPGSIVMACGRDGYVGAVRLEDGRIDMAAAVDGRAMKDAGGPAALARRVVADAGVDLVVPESWTVTPRLTRSRRQRGAMGVYVVGDAAGYVEPFTGEGMAWAMAGGAAVASFVDRAVDGWDASQAAGWEAAYRRVVSHRQWGCRAVAATLRRPWATGMAVRMLGVWPAAARPMVRSIARPGAWVGQETAMKRHAGVVEGSLR